MIVAAVCCCRKVRKGRSQDRNRPLTCVELRGFEPLTPSMPWSFVLLAGVADYGLTRGSEELSNAQRGSVLLHVGRRWLPTWLPKYSLATLIFEWLHTVSRPRALRFLSRHGAVGADVMPPRPEACED